MKHKRKLETYKCWKCKRKFKGLPGPTACKFCGHNYLTWVNFKKDWVMEKQGYLVRK